MTAAHSSADPAETQPALIAAARLLRSRWWLVVLCAVLGAALVGGYAATQSKVYTATTTLEVVDDVGDGLLTGTQVSTTEDPQRRAQTELALLRSRTIARSVSLSLFDGRVSAEDLLAEVDPSLDPETNVITLAVSDGDPARARAVADQWATQFVLLRQADRRDQYQALVSVLQRQRRELPASEASRRSELASRISELRVAATGTQAGVQVVDPATRPTEPSGPLVRRDAAIGLILGLALAIALVFALDVFDRRIKDAETLERVYGMLALALVPTPSRRDRDVGRRLEPYRILAGNLEHLRVEGPPAVVVVTSAVPAEGKTTAAASLAVAASQSGRRTVLVEADLRRPAAAEMLGMGREPGAPGLAEVLHGQAAVEDVVQVGEHGPALVPAGRADGNPADALRGPGIERAFARLVEDFELVVVDLPPLLPVADAQLMLDCPAVDAALVVARVGVTTRDEARRARAIIEGHRLQTTGLVVLGARESSSEGYATVVPEASPRLDAGTRRTLARRSSGDDPA